MVKKATDHGTETLLILLDSTAVKRTPKIAKKKTRQICLTGSKKHAICKH